MKNEEFFATIQYPKEYKKSYFLGDTSRASPIHLLMHEIAWKTWILERMMSSEVMVTFHTE